MTNCGASSLSNQLGVWMRWIFLLWSPLFLTAILHLLSFQDFPLNISPQVEFVMLIPARLARRRYYSLTREVGGFWCGCSEIIRLLPTPSHTLLVLSICLNIFFSLSCVPWELLHSSASSDKCWFLTMQPLIRIGLVSAVACSRKVRFLPSFCGTRAPSSFRIIILFIIKSTFIWCFIITPPRTSFSLTFT